MFQTYNEDQILNTEILQALNMVNKNHSFSSVNSDSNRFKKCSRTCKLLRNILKKKQNPNMLFNLVSLHLLKMNWVLMYKKLHTPLNLTSKTALAYMSIIVHMCQDFKKFVVPLQSTEPKIHVLYIKCVKLVKDLLSRFVTNDSFMKQTKLLPKEEIIQAINQEEKCNARFIIHILYPGYFVHFIYSPIPSLF